MGLRVVGAGLPRTGTTSVSEALERLLGAPCYHMRTLILDELADAPAWRDAMRGTPPVWDELLAGHAAAVDWPAAVFWRELAAANPDALVLLTVRESGEKWAASMERTVLPAARRFTEEDGWRTPAPDAPPGPFAGADPERLDAFAEMFRAFRASLPGEDHDALAAHHDRHAAEVRAAVPPERLVEMRPGDGWEPLCTALGVPVPDEDYPHLNSSDDWSAREREHRGAAPRG